MKGPFSHSKHSRPPSIIWLVAMFLPDMANNNQYWRMFQDFTPSTIMINKCIATLMNKYRYLEVVCMYHT